MSAVLSCGSRHLDLSQPVVMGVLNVTPDSFSDGGRFLRLDDALRHASQMLAEGAAIIDLGAESTRPGAPPVSDQEELDRLLPVLEAIASRFDIIVSIDTSSPVVMTESAARGAGLINDVRSLTRPGAMQAARDSGLPVCIMHMQGQPQTMQQAPAYDNVVDEVRGWLADRVEACVAAGITADRLILDPGFGFGKTLTHNLELLARLREIRVGDLPLLVGMSRKSMLGGILGGAAVDQRLYAGVTAAALAVERGAAIVRTHDVRATREAVAVAAALLPWR
ncbi:dihydropteroate synthase [Fluviicoccus keumensis]|uniref:Dihydropteroate synthase n=1 Tax=Fluviicoccus keumensis TaxID=1435465 RepID=A0A4Q7YNN2_9GAMM|nr:dihydropteroate synthase [Fluviicoccus keumensis]RZU38289.1 dihydropteroate synthase [Fluviicoccus keumensis]